MFSQRRRYSAKERERIEVLARKVATRLFIVMALIACALFAALIFAPEFFEHHDAPARFGDSR
jgi:hypothetical protein